MFLEMNLLVHNVVLISKKTESFPSILLVGVLGKMVVYCALVVFYIIRVNQPHPISYPRVESMDVTDCSFQ